MYQIKNVSLYSYHFSSASWRVRAVLHLKNIPFKYEHINLLKGAQHSSDFLKLNPFHQIPALKFTTNDDSDDKVLVQSIAIIEFLDEINPENPIYPKDALLKAKARSIVETICSGIQPLQNLETLTEYQIPLGGNISTPEEKQKISRFWVARKMAHLEDLVKLTAGKYCVGDEITLADICLVPQMFNAKRLELDTSKYPTLVAITERLNQLDMIKKSHPTACPDHPDNSSGSK